MEENNILYIWFNQDLWTHDLAISWVSSNWIFALSTERLYRIKKAPKTKYITDIKEYYKKPLEELLKKFKLEDYNKIVLINSPWFLEKDFKFNNVECIYNFNHHLFHSTSSYFMSWYNQSAILSMDWSWYDVNYDKEIMQSIRYWKWKDIKLLEETSLDNWKNLRWIGICYYLHSDFVWLSEWSFMWLSSYWDASKYKHIEIFKYIEWNVYINDIFFKWTKESNQLWLFNKWEFTQFYAIKNLMKIYWVSEDDMQNKKENIEKSVFADIAAKIQEETEKAIVFLANRAYHLTKSDNLCLSWWVSLNCLANTKILEETPFKNVFVQPACSDPWLSLGMCLYYYYKSIDDYNKKLPIINCSFWPEYQKSEIEKELVKYNNYLEYEYYTDFSTLIDSISTELENDKIIAWFQEWSEFWPRALWFRSILASPRSNKMKDRVNDIKLRERWRPLAPVILEECLEEYFETNYISPYMTFTSNVKEKKKDVIPSVVHIDWTARYQTVNKIQNLKLYNLIKLFSSKSWIPVLINTSFNSAWEPIIESPKQAIEMFLSTGIDFLVIWNFILRKEKKYKNFKFNLDEYEINELTLFWIKPDLYFKEVYVKLWSIFTKYLFNNDKDICISYSNFFNHYVFEFKYKGDIILLTFWYQNSLNYYFSSKIWVAVKWKSKSEYTIKLRKILKIAENNLIIYEDLFFNYFDKSNDKFFDKYK